MARQDKKPEPKMNYDDIAMSAQHTTAKLSDMIQSVTLHGNTTVTFPTTASGSTNVYAGGLTGSFPSITDVTGTWDTTQFKTDWYQPIPEATQALINALREAYVMGHLDHIPELKALVRAHDNATGDSIDTAKEAVKRLMLLEVELEERCTGDTPTGQ